MVHNKETQTNFPLPKPKVKSAEGMEPHPRQGREVHHVVLRTTQPGARRCQNHSVDDTVYTHAKGLVLRGRTVDYLHTLEGERGKRRQMVDVSQREPTRYICLMGQVMLKSSPMLGSIYSCIEKLLRETLRL